MIDRINGTSQSLLARSPSPADFSRSDSEPSAAAALSVLPGPTMKSRLSNSLLVDPMTGTKSLAPSINEAITSSVFENGTFCVSAIIANKSQKDFTTGPVRSACRSNVAMIALN
ncbi:Uncharacterised protein [Mycobacteroides abscessus]|nr:Uncharacterised protein [Mycobacteroides abscessus]